MNEVLAVYKPLGLTPAQLIAKLRQRFPTYEDVTISPAGRLDPMAEGLMLLLIGNANKKQSEFLTLDKTYQFTILFGVTTDTYDVLGEVVQTMHCSQTEVKNRLPQLLDESKGKQQQTFPPYSSKPVNGKPLFHYARHNQLDTISLPSKEVTIYELTLQKFWIINKNEVVNEIFTRIDKVKGDFRQEKIKLQWQKYMPSLQENLLIADCVARVSSGTYIRSLCHALGKELGCGALAYSIKRIQVGEYTLRDALYL